MWIYVLVILLVYLTLRVWQLVDAHRSVIRAIKLLIKQNNVIADRIDKLEAVEQVNADRLDQLETFASFGGGK